MDWITRAAFDRLLREAFPEAHVNRSEGKHGWSDTIDLNVLRLKVSVFTSGPNEGRVLCEILGVRTTIDHSETRLWHLWGRGEFGLRSTLGRLREVILGQAAGFMLVTGESQNLGKPLIGPPPPVKNPDDLGDVDTFLRSLFASPTSR